MKTNFYFRTCMNFFVLLFTLSFSLTSSCLYAQKPDSLLFRDDFNRATLGSFWQSNAQWSIVSGSAYILANGTGVTLKTSKSYSQLSYIVETSAKGFTSSYHKEFRVTFGQADLLNNAMYQVKYTADGGGRLTLLKSDNLYNTEILDEVAIFPHLNSTQWYKFKIAKYKSGLIQVFLNQGTGYTSIPLLEAIDLTYTKLGHTGWQIDTESVPEDFYIDWFSALKPGVEKPAVKEKPEEDDLITQVSAKSGKSYKVTKLTAGVKQYTDRDYTITSLPGYLKGASFIQTANSDKLNTNKDLLSFFLQENAIVYIAYDSRSTTTPEWLSEWNKTTDRIGTSDKDVNYLDVYSKFIESDARYVPIVLGGNLASPAVGAKTNYIVVAVKRPSLNNLQAEDAKLSGAVAANVHTNYNGTGYADFINLSKDYIEWTVKINVPGTYSLGFTFANAGTSERLLQISADGLNAGTASFSSFSTSWSSWSFLSGPDVYLTSGVHKIRATATGTSGPNIDELSFYFVSPSATVPVSQGIMALPVNSSLLNNNTVGKFSDQFISAYPNPFLQSTKINYSLKEKAKVNLSIYNLQGQQLQVLENRVREAGNYQATFNAGTFAKGIYFYRLQTGNNVKVGKLVKN